MNKIAIESTAVAEGAAYERKRTDIKTICCDVIALNLRTQG
jgi:hypothetical protein